MTTLAGEPATAATSDDDRYEPKTGPIWALRDSWTEAVRHLRIIPRNIELIMFATLQPIMFVLLFNFVFGGAIAGVDNYTQFLLPGVFAQTVLFGSAFTGIGLATDMEKGYVDRLRTLPISQSAVLTGRTLSDFIRNLITFTVMIIVGFLIGFRFEGGIADGLLACLLLLAFSYAFSWIQALIGLSVKSVEAANSAGFIWMFPLTFVSSAFVPTESMPSWLQPVADANPFTKVTNAARALYGGLPAGDDVWISMLWAIGITVVFAFLAVRKFTGSVAR
jgi:ABC transporter DrrB family efflux protein